MGIEIGGLLGLIILIADVWAIVKTVGSSASTGGKVFWIVLILILPVMGKYFGQLCLVVTALTVVPLAVSLIHAAAHHQPIFGRYGGAPRYPGALHGDQRRGEVLYLFFLSEEETKLRMGDGIVILTHSECIDDLRERWNPKEAKNNEP